MGGLQAFIAKVNGAAILAFEGTDPLKAAQWLLDWDMYGQHEIGELGRVHPGFRTVLGLDKNLRPLSNARCHSNPMQTFFSAIRIFFP